MQSLRKAERWLVLAERGLLTGLLGFMVALAFVQVVLRQVGLRTGVALSVLWGDTLLRHLVLWVGFLGAGVAAASDRQFAMDAAAHLFTGRRKARVALTCHLFTAWVCVGLLRASYAYLAQERLHGGVLFSLLEHDVMVWWFEAIAPAGFLLLLLHYSIKAVESAWAGFWPGAEPAPETGSRVPEPPHTEVHE